MKPDRRGGGDDDGNDDGNGVDSPSNRSVWSVRQEAREARPTILAHGNTPNMAIQVHGIGNETDTQARHCSFP